MNSCSSVRTPREVTYPTNTNATSDLKRWSFGSFTSNSAPLRPMVQLDRRCRLQQDICLQLMANTTLGEKKEVQQRYIQQSDHRLIESSEVADVYAAHAQRLHQIYLLFGKPCFDASLHPDTKQEYLPSMTQNLIFRMVLERYGFCSQIIGDESDEKKNLFFSSSISLNIEGDHGQGTDEDMQLLQSIQAAFRIPLLQHTDSAAVSRDWKQSLENSTRIIDELNYAFVEKHFQAATEEWLKSCREDQHDGRARQSSVKRGNKDCLADPIPSKRTKLVDSGDIKNVTEEKDSVRQSKNPENRSRSPTGDATRNGNDISRQNLTSRQSLPYAHSQEHRPRREDDREVTRGNPSHRRLNDSATSVDHRSTGRAEGYFQGSHSTNEKLSGSPRPRSPRSRSPHYCQSRDDNRRGRLTSQKHKN